MMGMALAARHKSTKLVLDQVVKSKAAQRVGSKKPDTPAEEPGAFFIYVIETEVDVNLATNSYATEGS